MIRDIDLLKSAEMGPLRSGKNSLIKYLKGGSITRKQAMNAKCYDCNGMGESKVCDIETCSLFAYSPYRIKAR